MSSLYINRLLFVPPTEIKICSEWECYLPVPENPTEISNLNWSSSHEKAFKDLTSLMSKMNLSPKNMDKLSHLLNSESVPINDLFENNRELFFNEGELAKLLLEIGANVPMKDFNTHLIEVKVDLKKMDDSKIWIMPSKNICIKDVLKTFPDSQRDFYENLSSERFFNALSSNYLLINKDEVWSIMEHFKENKVSRSGNQTAPSTLVSCNGNIDEIFLKLLSSQAKLFNNNFQLLRELTGLDQESFNSYLRVFIGSLRREESINAMRIILKDSTCYSGEISALVNELRNQTPLYKKSGILIDWQNSKYNLEEVISSLVKIKGDSLFNLNSFRLVKRQKATDIFNLRFTHGVADPRDVEWWKDFNQLCIEIKFLEAFQTEWIHLSYEERQAMKIVFIGQDQKTVEEFMDEDLLITHRKLTETLQDICQDAPFNKQYLLDNHWCYSEYSILLEKNNITLKVRKGTLDYKFFTKFILNFSLGYIVIWVFQDIF